MKNWELTSEEYDQLTLEQQQKYDRAKYYKSQTNAGGPGGGWSDGNDILISMGWREARIREGHRDLISLEKPEKVKH